MKKEDLRKCIWRISSIGEKEIWSKRIFLFHRWFVRMDNGRDEMLYALIESNDDPNRGELITTHSINIKFID